MPYEPEPIDPTDYPLPIEGQFTAAEFESHRRKIASLTAELAECRAERDAEPLRRFIVAFREWMETPFDEEDGWACFDAQSWKNVVDMYKDHFRIPKEIYHNDDGAALSASPAPALIHADWCLTRRDPNDVCNCEAWRTPEKGRTE